jgi:N-acetylglutamate synthase-like GNAT family acetyltransferase
VTEGGEFAATGSIKLRELPDHAEKQFWLGEIFVLPEYRNQGLGTRLTNVLAKHAFDHGVKSLYLYTPDKQALYMKLGWIELSESSVNGEEVTLMVRKSDA